MSFRKELEQLLNRYSKENVSDTPDYVLAEYVLNSLDAFDLCVRARDEYYGRKIRKPFWVPLKKKSAPQES